MSRIAICLWFDTEAEQAAQHYVRIFKEMGREASVGSIGRYGPGGRGPVGGVMTANFRLDAQAFMGLNGGPIFKHSPAASIIVNCADQAEIDGFWNRLLDGGQPSQCGWLTDRFGVSWQIVPEALERLVSSDVPDQSARVMREVLGMVKLDIATLERAAAAG
ncbi:MAG TPA: VOC family protein [Caulobacteraceae bacterium]|jgi:predicted 3-demethylubiquinone-9 3-methyltransferase (glyoxalase superfamily)